MKRIRDVAIKIGGKIVEEIQKNIVEQGLEESNLSKNIRFEADESSIVVYAPEYFDYAEKGRGPGGVPTNFENILKNWISRHSIKFDGEEKVFVQNVKWKTVKEGSRLYRNPSEQRDFLKGVSEKAEKLIEEEISESLIKEIRDLKKVF